MSDNKLALVPRSVAEAESLSKQLSQAQILGVDLRGKPADVLAAVLAGLEMGLAPMAALRGIHVIKGKPVLSADTMVAVVLGSGKAKYFRRVAEADDSVTYETCRDGSEPQRCVWTMAMAKRASLNGDNWAKFPRAMLAARAKSELARDVYPDVLAGCYTEDEAGDFETRESVIDVQAVDLDPQLLADALTAINDAATLDELQAVAMKLQTLPESQKAEARITFAARKRELAHANVAAGVPA
ncbi:MAG: hypothetical protein E6Q97_05040 [Desulfurellales bacterium]|nr:MAG: hypothetical protein E6Q97_05040 [Desulfurellales bacterium]